MHWDCNFRSIPRITGKSHKLSAETHAHGLKPARAFQLASMDSRSLRLEILNEEACDGIVVMRLQYM